MAGVGKLFTRRARFGKTVEPAGRTLIGKQGEDLLFWRSQSTHECDLQNKRFSPRFLFHFCTVEAYFFENHCHPSSLKEKKVFCSIHDGSLSLCKCRRARIKKPASRIWPAGRDCPCLTYGLISAPLHHINDLHSISKKFLPFKTTTNLNSKPANGREQPQKRNEVGKYRRSNVTNRPYSMDESSSDWLCITRLVELLFIV